MSKKVSFGARPSTTAPPPAADAWVAERAASPASTTPMKRLTLDIPADLHRAIKTACASRGTKIVDELRELLVQKYGNP
jgi:ParG